VAEKTEAVYPADQTELFIALVAAVGTDVTMVSEEIAVELGAYGYTTHHLRLSQYLAEVSEQNFKDKLYDEWLWDAMTAGDELRTSWGRSDALALHAISDIVATREQLNPTADPEDEADYLDRHAFVLRSLKTPDELDTLRAVYGPRLVVIAAYSPKDQRLKDLATRIAGSRQTDERDRWAHQPLELVNRDEQEDRERGQNVSDTFHRADFFIRARNRTAARKDIRRTFEILFGSPFRTPTREEHGQFIAAGAALRSAELSRQVGAAIADGNGSIIAVGTSFVPTAGGGSHWEEDGKGNREFELGELDTNQEAIDRLAGQLGERLDKRVGEIARSLIESHPEAREALDLARAKLGEMASEELKDGGLKDLTEFGRSLHAEMGALLDAARRGVSVAGATLHSTTFPCHNCARHIIGAGIGRVIFIEPYTKSRAEQLHADSATIAQSTKNPKKVAFDPFVGVAPRRYLEMFDAAVREQLGNTGRRNAAGRRSKFVKKQAHPVFADAGLAQFRPEPREYRVKELLALAHFAAHSTDPEQSVRADGDAPSKD
jgi:deoxycytidylate deaminase